MAYRPKEPFTVPMYLYPPVQSKVKGVIVKAYKESERKLFYGTFKTFGGTESTTDGLLAVVDTANIETWYRPDIKADCHIMLANNPDKIYEIIGEPENIEMRNQFIKFKVQAISGGA